MNNLVITSLLTGVICLSIYNFTLYPNYAKSIPKTSVWSLIITIIRGGTVHDRYERILWPKLKQRGYVLGWGPFGWFLIVSKPEIAKNIFRNTNQFSKPVFKMPGSLMSQFFGESNIVTSNGDEWKRLRRPANPIFHQSFHTDMFAPYVLETLQVFSERSVESHGEPIPVKDLMELMTLDVLGKGIFSHDFEAVKSRGKSNYHQLYTQIMKSFINPLFVFLPFIQRLPFGPHIRARQHIEEFNQFILGLIDQRRHDLEEGKFTDSKDLLSTMLRADPDNPYPALTNDELVNNLNIFFMAGHDTTANTLSYEMYHLAKNPQVQQKLRSEIYKVLNLPEDHSEIVIPTIDQLKQLEYLNLVIKETMRISPAVLLLNRRLEDDYLIPEDNITLPKGTTIGLSVYAILRDPAIYPDPDVFNPERFLNRKYDTDVYMPFGGGSRMCVGMNFSLMEQKVFLTMLLQKFELTIGTNNPDFDRLRLTGYGMTRSKDLKLNFIERF